MIILLKEEILQEKVELLEELQDIWTINIIEFVALGKPDDTKETNGSYKDILNIFQQVEK